LFNVEGTEFFLRAVEEEFGGLGGLRGKRMLELGNQIMWQPHVHGAFPEVPDVRTAKEWFEGLGVAHVSVDLNGQDGALALDLTTPGLMPEWRGTFDIVTNEGTLEHLQSLSGILECLKNVHEWTRRGGLMVHALPPPPTKDRPGWRGHCRAFFEEGFPKRLAKENGYRVVLAERQRLDTLGGHVDYLSAALRKEARKGHHSPGDGFTSRWGRLFAQMVWV
jgi:hypothetical protein